MQNLYIEVQCSFLCFTDQWILYLHVYFQMGVVV